MGSKAVVRPPKLSAGSRIALVAPAGPLVERDDVTRASELCRALGYVPTVGPHALDKYGYLAGGDDARLADLNAALAAPEVDAVWCIRGGYGITRLLSRVDFAGFARHPKPVIGYSDITALLVALHQETGVVTFHGPTARASMPAFTRHHFERVVARAEPAGPRWSAPTRTWVRVLGCGPHWAGWRWPRTWMTRFRWMRRSSGCWAVSRRMRGWRSMSLRGNIRAPRWMRCWRKDC